MGANSSTQSADGMISRIYNVKNKPQELKSELTRFNELVPLEHNMDAKVDKKLVDILFNLVKLELQALKDQNQRNMQQGLPPQFGGGDIHLIMQAIQRLLRFRSFYMTIPKCSVVPLIDAIQNPDPAVVYSTLSCVQFLLDCRCPEDKKFPKEQAEMLVKQAFYESKGYEVLVKMLVKYGRTDQVGIVSKIVDILSLDLVDHCTTTRFVALQKIISFLQPHLDLLISLSIHRHLDTRCYGSILLQGLLLHSSAQYVSNFQQKVLDEGTILWYMLFAIDGSALPNEHPYKAQWYDKNLTELSRNLLGLICAGNEQVIQVVLKAIPKVLQEGIDDGTGQTVGGNSDKKEKEKKQSAPSLSRVKKADKEMVKSTLWNTFQTGRMKRVTFHSQFQQLDKERKEPHCIWTVGMKAELCDCLRSELDSIYDHRQIKDDIKWDYEGYEVKYDSLQRFLRVGGYYVSLLLPTLTDKNSSYLVPSEKRASLLASLFQQAVVEDDPSWKFGCLKAMFSLIEKYPDQLLNLELMPYLTWLLNPVHTHPAWRDEIMRFLRVLGLKHPQNVKRFVATEGIEYLLSYISKVFQAVKKEEVKENKDAKKVPTSPASPSKEEHDDDDEDHVPAKKAVASDDDDEDDAAEEVGPDGKKKISRQNLLKHAPPTLKDTEVALLSLELLRLIPAGGPKMKRLMAEKNVVNTLIRLLLCPYPAIKEEGIKLLLEITDHSAHLIPHLITSGMFHFLILAMRNGVSPVMVELINKTHTKQDRYYVPEGHSALELFFPRQLAETLATQGGEAFAQLFEKDSGKGVSNPLSPSPSNLLWNAGLKKHLMETMTRRLAPFKQALEKDPLTPFIYTPIEPVRYPSLESELAMAGVPLKQLVETGGVPDLLARLNIQRPDILMEELVSSMLARRFAGIDLLHILTAQSIIIRRFPDVPDAMHYRGFPALYEIIEDHRDPSQNYPLVDKACDVIHCLLSSPLVMDSDNIALFFDTNGPQMLCKNIVDFVMPATGAADLKHPLVQRILVNLFLVVFDLASKIPQDGDIADVVGKIVKAKNVVKSILSVTTKTAAQKYPTLTVGACRTLMSLCLVSSFQDILLESGHVLHLVDVAVFYRPANAHDLDMGGNAANAKQGMDEERKLRLAAAHVLAILAGYGAALRPAELNDKLLNVVQNILTPFVASKLQNPAEFVAFLQQPSVKDRLVVLYKYVTEELNVISHSNDGKWSSKRWPFQPLAFNLESAGGNEGAAEENGDALSSTGGNANTTGSNVVRRAAPGAAGAAAGVAATQPAARAPVNRQPSMSGLTPQQQQQLAQSQGARTQPGQPRPGVPQQQPQPRGSLPPQQGGPASTPQQARGGNPAASKSPPAAAAAAVGASIASGFNKMKGLFKKKKSEEEVPIPDEAYEQDHPEDGYGEQHGDAYDAYGQQVDPYAGYNGAPAAAAPAPAPAAPAAHQARSSSFVADEYKLEEPQLEEGYDDEVMAAAEPAVAVPEHEPELEQVHHEEDQQHEEEDAYAAAEKAYAEAAAAVGMDEPAESYDATEQDPESLGIDESAPHDDEHHDAQQAQHDPEYASLQ